MNGDRLKTPLAKNFFHAEISQLINTKNQFSSFYLTGSFNASNAHQGYYFFGLSNRFYQKQEICLLQNNVNIISIF